MGAGVAENPPPCAPAKSATPASGVGTHPVTEAAPAQAPPRTQPGVAAAPTAAGAHAAAPSAAAAPSPLAHPQPAASPQPDQRADVVKFLGETIGWYQHLASEERLATEPAETLFLDESWQMALVIVKLAFQYARAEAALLKSEKPPTAASSTQTSAAGKPAKIEATASSGLATLMTRAQAEQNNFNRLKQQAEQLKAGSARAKAGQRAQLARQLAIVQSQIELAQSRLDSYNALIQFEATAISGSNQGTGLWGQIDALERSLPQLNAPAKGAVPAPQEAPPAVVVTTRNANQSTPASDNGLLGTIETLIGLGREQSTFTDRISETRQLAAMTDAARAPLIARLRELNANADAMAAQPGGDDLAATARASNSSTT